MIQDVQLSSLSSLSLSKSITNESELNLINSDMMTTDLPGINLANAEGIPKTKRDQCSVCKMKSGKTLHMTADCTGFSKDEVSTIIKLSRNLLHVCNDCSNERKDDFCILTPEQQKQMTDLNSLDEKLTQYNEDVIQCLHVVKEIDSLKRDQLKSYTEALRSVTWKNYYGTNSRKMK